jgi:hypothetical protein
MRVYALDSVATVTGSIESNGTRLINDELERMWNELIMFFSR